MPVRLVVAVLTVFGALAFVAAPATAQPRGSSGSAASVGSPASVKAAASVEPPDPCADVAHHITAARSGYSCSPLAPNATQIWSDTLNGTASYPIIANGRVFETTSNPNGAQAGGSLYALDAATGDIDWGPVPLGGTYDSFPMAYDNGILFADDFDGLLVAFDAATGTELWAQPLGNFAGEPVASGGVVYVESGAPVVAVSESTGAVLWSADVDGDGGAVAVDSTGVYGNGGCSEYRLTLAGQVAWDDNQGCEGGGGGTSFLGGGLYFSQTGDYVLAEANGAARGTFNGVPAFSGGDAFIASQTTLFSETVPTLTPRFSVTLPSAVTAGPVIANGVVYVATADAHLYGLSTATGAIVTVKSLPGVANAGGGITFTSPDIGIGDDLLVAPTGDVVTAFGGSGQNVPGTGACTLAISGVYQGNLLITSGTACLLDATVTGQVVVYPGAELLADDSSMSDLLANRAAAITACGDSIAGPVVVLGSTGYVLLGDGGAGSLPCSGNTLGSYVILGWVGSNYGNTGGVELGGNQIASTVAIVDNSVSTASSGDGAIEVDANSISGALLCSGNTPAAINDGRPNTVTGTIYGTCPVSQANSRAPQPQRASQVSYRP